MAKLKGYVGAMIVVFALMGSILLGYASNISGATAIVNDYDSVTDVTGLYNRTQEKQFIEYNPAENYINYQTATETYTNPALPVTWQKVTHGTWTVTNNNGTATASDGNNIISTTTINSPDNNLFICQQMMVFVAGTNNLMVSYYNGGLVDKICSSVTITVSGSTVTCTTNDNTVITRSNQSLILIKNEIDWDYYGIFDATITTTLSDIYLNDPSQGMVQLAGSSPYGRQVAVGNSYYSFITGYTTTMATYTKTMNVNTDVGLYNIGNLDYKISRYWYPVSVQSDTTIGVDYTKSNRVNNYPAEYEYTAVPSTSTNTIQLQNNTGVNYWSGGKWFMGNYYYLPGQQFDGQNTYGVTFDIYAPGTTYKYKLSDVLASITLPANTTQIVFDNGNTSYSSGQRMETTMSGHTYTIGSVPTNLVTFTSAAGHTDINMLVSTELYASQKAVYDVASGLVDIYNYQDVKVSTSLVTETYVQFVARNAISGTYNFDLTEPEDSRPHRYGSGTFTLQGTRTQPFINMKITSNGYVQNVTYMDPTKGIKINPAYNNDVIWNNNYENGDIQILFRAAETYQAYHNELTVSGNTIAVDYDGGRYHVTLNDGEAVDIGTWRNIILDIDLINGKLSVIPVRTFNSFMNVVNENANIIVGDLLTPSPTSTITWLGTSNSLMLSVYNTRVFLDTYGVVMVDPSLNITSYFTNLDNFYKLDLNGFSVLGDSMTVNGITGEVANNYVTFNDQTVELKKLSIEYAGGHVYVNDSNASIDLGEITTNEITFNGIWYFTTQLQKGFTTEKLVYDWNWGDFVLNNTQFCIFYIGIAIVGFIIAKRFCTFHVSDYALLALSVIIALTVQVIA